MIGDRADATQAARVLVRDQPIGAGCAPLGQHADEILEAAGDEVVDDANADAGAHGLELRHCARAFEAGRRAVKELAHVGERRRERVLLDVADEPVAFERRDVGRPAVSLEVAD